MTSRGPEDVISNGYSDDDAGTYRVSDWTAVDGVTELDVPLEDAEFETAKHSAASFADELRRADGTPLPDPTPRLPYRARGEAPPPKPPVRSHRRAQRRWWQRIDWPLIIVLPCTLAAIALVTYILAAMASTSVDGPLLAASQEEVLRIQAQMQVALVLAAYASVIAIVALLARRG